jgi:ribonuclease P protein component
MVDVNQAASHQGRERLRRVDRLRSAKDYQRVNRTGSRTAGRHFVLQQAPGFNVTQASLGLVVSRRVGNAVTRNHVKRRVREWFRRNRESLDASDDFVVIARAGSGGLDGAAIASELNALVMR